ncbi:MAG: hypothetical protein II889_03670 [Clostridia bacterium]|nr:hypothetical protein [Clostridia bacterium]
MKHNRLTRLLAVLLAIALLAGCGKGKKTEEPEQTGDPNILTHLVDSQAITLEEGAVPDTMTAFEWDEERGELRFTTLRYEEAAGEDGEITTVARRAFCRTDGETILSSVPLPESEDGSWYRTGSIRDGILWYLSVRMDGSVGSSYLNRFDPASGEVVTYDTDLAALVTDGSLPQAFTVGAEGRFCISYGTQLLLFDEKLLVKNTVSVQPVMHRLFSLPDGRFLLHYDNGSAVPIDAKTGKLGEVFHTSSRASAAPGSGDYLFFYSNEGGVYGVREAKKGSWEKDTIADLTNSGLVGNLEHVCAVGDGRVFAVQTSIMTILQDSLVVHDPIPDVDLRTVKKIVVATRYPEVGMNIKDAMRIFNASHPGYRIVIDDRSGDPPDIDFPAPGGKMTLDMVTGSYKPDILLSEGVGSYIEQAFRHGLCRDLTPYLEADERVNPDNLFGSVKRMFDDGAGGMWGITNGVSIYPTLVSTREILGEIGERGCWTIEEFLDFAESLGEGRELLWNLTRGSSVSDEFLSQGAYRAFVDQEAGTCSFDSPDFVRFLRFLDALPTEEEYRRTSPFAELDSDGRAEMRLSGRIALAKCQPDALGLAPFKLFNTKDWVLIGYPSSTREAGAGIQIDPTEVFVITTFCEEPDLAWDFIRETFIGGEGRGGISTSLREDLRRSAEDYYGHAQIAYFGDHPYPIYMPGSSEEFTEADLEYPGALYVAEPEDTARMEAILDSAGDSLVGRWDRSLWMIIREEISAFLGGVGTAEECAGKIQSRASIYLAEQH